MKIQRPSANEDLKTICPIVPLTFSFAQLAKGKSLGRSKPATNSQAQALATHCVENSTTTKSYRTAFYRNKMSTTRCE